MTQEMEETIQACRTAIAKAKRYRGNDKLLADARAGEILLRLIDLNAATEDRPATEIIIQLTKELFAV